MATKKNNPKAATRTRKADKKEKVTPAIKASARTKKKDMKLPEGQFVIRGTVRDSNGKLVAKATVLAFDCDLRNKQQLGKDVVTVTDADGRYEIRYTMKEFAAGDSTPNASPDLLVRIVDANNKDKVLAESPTRFNAGREETIDLVIAAPALSEWIIISQAVIPLLISQGLDGKPLPPWELNDEDISFIVKETGLDREQVRLWVLAIKTAREVVLITPLPSSGLPSNWHSHHHTGEGGVTGTEAGDLLELIVFYGWFRDGQPQVFAELMRRSTDDLMTSLARAITQRYIPAIDQQLKDSLRKTLDASRIDDVLKPAKEGEPASIGDVLGTISSKQLPPEKTKIVAGILLHTKHEDADFLEKLAKAGIDNSQAIQVRRTLRIGKLTTDHVPMIKALQPLVADAADDSLTALTSIALDQWLDLAYTRAVARTHFF